METMYYIGLKVHKTTIGYCAKDVSGRVYAEGSVPATLRSNSGRPATTLLSRQLPRADRASGLLLDSAA